MRWNTCLVGLMIVSFFPLTQAGAQGNTQSDWYFGGGVESGISQLVTTTHIDVPAVRHLEVSGLKDRTTAVRFVVQKELRRNFRGVFSPMVVMQDFQQQFANQNDQSEEKTLSYQVWFPIGIMWQAPVPKVAPFAGAKFGPVHNYARIPVLASGYRRWVAGGAFSFGIAIPNRHFELRPELIMRSTFGNLLDNEAVYDRPFVAEQRLETWSLRLTALWNWL